MRGEGSAHHNGSHSYWVCTCPSSLLSPQRTPCVFPRQVCTLRQCTTWHDLWSVSHKGEWQLPAKERFKFMFLDLRLKSSLCSEPFESYLIDISVFALVVSTATLINIHWLKYFLSDCDIPKIVSMSGLTVKQMVLAPMEFTFYFRRYFHSSKTTLISQ